jgi:hypothetical protein
MVLSSLLRLLKKMAYAREDLSKLELPRLRQLPPMPAAFAELVDIQNL